MVKTLTKHGNSLALVIDKPILELLHIDEDTPLSISTDGNCLVIARAENSEKEARFEEVLKKVNRDWGTVLKRLAE